MHQSRIPVVIATMFLLSLGAMVSCSVAAPAPGRELWRLDANWRFHLGDFGRESESGVPVLLWRYQDAPPEAETRADALAAALDFGDTGWKDLAPGQDTFNGKTGFQWYTAPLGETTGSNPTIHFDNVDDNATVYLNGQRLKYHEGWDEAFDVPLGPAWRKGGPNTLLVLVQNTAGPGNVGPTFLRTGSATQVQVSVPDAAKPAYNDRSWRQVHVPHDFVVEGKFDPRADNSHGSLPTGVGWYRRKFFIPASDKGRSLWIDFDGIYRNASIWLNGQSLGNHPSGYIGVRYDITRQVRYGGENVLVVRADARSAEGWWYEGGGIYRHVWLNKSNALHATPWGTFVTAKLPDEINPQSAAITVQTEVANDSTIASPVKLVSLLQDASGKTLKTLASPVTMAAGRKVRVTQQVILERPMLWSVERPYLYRVVTRLQKAGQVLDESQTSFGIRSIRFDANNGFFLNGKPVKLKGTCNHQDHAGVGIAMPDSLLMWRLKQLKAMGSNAYRCSHNPPAPELLDACDRLGILVMDETRHLGDSTRAKSSLSTPYSDLSELRNMVLRDRNHPSIILWSMANEEFALQPTEYGLKILNAMKAATKELDPTRPVTAAINGVWNAGISRGVDVQGFNYNIWIYDRHHKDFPNEPMVGSETGSAVSTRGIYENDPVKTYVSAYDVNAPEWATGAETAWKPIAERPFMAGGFVWTGFDYKGEPTPYRWPSINSHFGIMDMCGFPKDTYYYYQAWWGQKRVVHLLPHWNWAGKEGQPIKVWCHGNTDTVELWLNGQSLGTKAMPRNGHLEWTVAYAPGRLEARGYNQGKLAASDTRETTGAPAQIILTADRTALQADNQDLIPVEVAIADAQGRIVPTAGNEVTFQLTSKGRIAGVGNGDPASHEPDKANKRRAFNGLCQVLIQASFQTGPIQLRATSPGLRAAHLELKSIPPAVVRDLR